MTPTTATPAATDAPLATQWWAKRVSLWMLLMLVTYILLMLVRTRLWPDYGRVATPMAISPLVGTLFGVAFLLVWRLDFKSQTALRHMFVGIFLVAVYSQLRYHLQGSWTPIWMLPKYGMAGATLLFVYELSQPAPHPNRPWRLRRTQGVGLLLGLVVTALFVGAALWSDAPFGYEMHWVLRAVWASWVLGVATWVLWRGGRTHQPEAAIQQRLAHGVLVLAVLLFVVVTMLRPWLNAHSTHAMPNDLPAGMPTIALALWLLWQWPRAQRWFAPLVWVGVLLWLGLMSRVTPELFMPMMPVAALAWVLLVPRRGLLLALPLWAGYAWVLGRTPGIDTTVWGLFALSGLMVVMTVGALRHWVASAAGKPQPAQAGAHAHAAPDDAYATHEGQAPSLMSGWLARLSDRQISLLAGAGLAAVVLVLGGSMVMQGQAAKTQQAQQQAQTASMQITRQVLEGFDRIEHEAHMMGRWLVHAPAKAQMDEAAAAFLEGVGSSLRLRWAPNGVMRHLWPPEGDERVLGMDLLNDPAQGPALQAVVASGQGQWRGPFKLKLDFDGLVYNLPVFGPPTGKVTPGLPGEFVGLFNVVVDLRQHLDFALFDLNERFTGLGWAVWVGADRDHMRQVLGPASVPADAVHTHGVVLPYDQHINGRKNYAINTEATGQMYVRVAVWPQSALAGVSNWVMYQQVMIAALVLGWVAFVLTRNQLAQNANNRAVADLAHMQSVLDKAKSGYLLVTPQGVSSWASASLARLLGVPHGKLVNWDMANAKWGNLVMPQVSLALKGQHAEPIYLKGTSAFSIELDVRVNVSAVEVGGQPHALLEMEDLREQHAQEAALRESQLAMAHARDRLQTIFDNAMVCLAVFEGRQVSWINEGAFGIIGRTPEELVGQSTRVFFASDEEWAAIGKETFAAHSQGLPYEGELQVQHKNGERRWVHLTMRVVAGSQPMQAVAVFYDITDHVERQQQLLEQKEHQSAIMASVQESILVLDDRGFVLEVNPAFCELLGYTPQDVVGQALLKFKVYQAEANQPDAPRNYREVLQRPYRFDDQYRRADGTLIDVEVKTVPAQLNGKQVVISTARDISARKKLEQANQAAREAAERADQAKTRFLGNMSHEMRTPLNALLGYSRMLQVSGLQPKQQVHLGKMQEAGEHLLALINDVLDFAKLEHGEFQLSEEAFWLTPLLQSVGNLMSGQAQLKRLDLHIEPVAPDLKHAWLGDPQRLRQILINLVGNALKFTEEGSVSVRVLAGPEAGLLCFEVSDTGVGISEDSLAKLFGRFSQVDDGSTRHFQGTGLGLAIVKELAMAMGGDVNVRSVVGQGSTFAVCVRLKPATEADTPLSSAMDDLPEARAVADAVRLQGARVLVVDDSAMNREVATAFLEAEGMVVAEAPHGQAALDWLQAHPDEVDVVLMDVHMPVMDGLTAVKLIRQDAAWQALPIVAMTAGATQSDRDSALAAGMNDYLLKPFEPARLVAVLAKWVVAHRPERAQTEAAPALTGGEQGLALDGTGAGDANKPVAPAAQPDDWPDLPSVDMAAARSRMGGQRAMFVRQIERLHDEFGPWVSAPPQLQDLGEAAEWTGTLHKLKGNSGLIGAMAVHDAARDAEAQLKAATDLPAVNHALAGVVAQLQRLFDDAAPLLSAPAVGASVATPSAARPDPAEFADLLTALDSNSYGAVKLFETMAPAVVALVGASTQQTMVRQVQDLAFVEVAQALREALNR